MPAQRGTFSPLCSAIRGILSHSGFPSSVWNSVAKWQRKKIIGSQINRNLYSVLLCNFTFLLLTWELIFSCCAPTPPSPIHESVIIRGWSGFCTTFLSFPCSASVPWGGSAFEGTPRVSAFRGVSQKLESFPSPPECFMWGERRKEFIKWFVEFRSFRGHPFASFIEKFLVSFSLFPASVVLLSQAKVVKQLQKVDEETYLSGQGNYQTLRVNLWHKLLTVGFGRQPVRRAQKKSGNSIAGQCHGCRQKEGLRRRGNLSAGTRGWSCTAHAFKEAWGAKVSSCGKAV